MSKVTGVKKENEKEILLDCCWGKKEFALKCHSERLRNSWFQASKLFSETYMNVTD